VRYWQRSRCIQLCSSAKTCVPSALRCGSDKSCPQYPQATSTNSRTCGKVSEPQGRNLNLGGERREPRVQFGRAAIERGEPDANRCPPQSGHLEDHSQGHCGPVEKAEKRQRKQRNRRQEETFKMRSSNGHIGGFGPLCPRSPVCKTDTLPNRASGASLLSFCLD
jgi:hypothetical protein